MHGHVSSGGEGGALPDPGHVPLSSPDGLRRLGQALAVARRIAEALDSEEAGRRTADGICEILQVSSSCLYRLDPASGSLIPIIASSAVNAELARALVFPRGTGASGLAVSLRGPVVTRDVLTDPRISLPPAVRDRIAAAAAYRAVLAVPLVVEERVVGALGAGDRLGRVFTEEDVWLAQVLADQAAPSLEAARLRDEVEAARHEAEIIAGITAQRLLESETLLAVSRAVDSTLDATETMRRVARETARALGADMVGVYHVASDHTALLPIAGYHVPRGLRETFRKIPLPLKDHPFLEDAWRQPRPVACANVPTDPRIHPAVMANFPHRSLLFCPMVVKEAPVGGIVALWWTAEREFSATELRLVDGISRQAALTLENVELYERMARAQNEAEVIAGLAQTLNASLDLGTVLSRVARAARDLCGADIARIALVDETDGALTFRYWAGSRIEDWDGVRIVKGQGVGGRVLETAEPMRVDDYSEDPRFDKEIVDFVAREGIKSVMAVPIRSGDRVEGVLFVDNRARRPFTDRDESVVTQLAEHAAIAVRNAHLYEQAERRRQEAEQAGSETEQLLASISWILIAVDEQDRVTRWNGAAESSFGILAADIVGRPLAEAAFAWDWPSIVEPIRQCRNASEPARLSDVRYRRPDGKDGFLSLTVTPITAQDNVHAGALLLASDVTERRLLEMQLSQAQKLESIGQLAAGVAHEINTPIQFVGDNVRFLDDAFHGLLQLVAAYREVPQVALDETVRRVEADADIAYTMDEVPRAIVQTLDGVTRVATIVRAMKQFAHPDQGRNRILTDINEALASTLTVARNELKKVAEVETDFGELPLVLCLPGDLNQVFLNLIINAAHAVGDVVKDSGEKGCIRVRTTPDEDAVVIAISDTGGGIPEHIQSRIFDPFFTTKEVGRGTGQGLAIARDVVVNKHRGALTFETEPGRGTTFFVRLPVALDG